MGSVYKATLTLACKLRRVGWGLGTLLPYPWACKLQRVGWGLCTRLPYPWACKLRKALGTRLVSCSLQTVYKFSWSTGVHFVCCVVLLWCANFNDVSAVQMELLSGQSINVHYQLLLCRKNVSVILYHHPSSL